MVENILGLLISTAYAETTMVGSPGQGSSFSFIIMFVIFFLFIYFAVWRPQNKRTKEQQQLMHSLAKGDEVITTGGMYGRITKISDSYITLSIANNTDIVMQKSSIVNVLPKGTLKTME